MSRFSFSLLYSMGQGCLECLNRRADQQLTHVDMRRLRHGVQDDVRDVDVLQDLRAGGVNTPSPVTAGDSGRPNGGVERFSPNEPDAKGQNRLGLWHSGIGNSCSGIVGLRTTRSYCTLIFTGVFLPVLTSRTFRVNELPAVLRASSSRSGAKITLSLRPTIASPGSIPAFSAGLPGTTCTTLTTGSRSAVPASAMRPIARAEVAPEPGTGVGAGNGVFPGAGLVPWVTAPAASK